MTARVLHPEPLSRDRWFSHLPAPLAESLLSVAVPRRLAAGQRVCLRGQRHSGMWCLLSGIVHVLNPPQPERDSFLDSCDPPTWFGELGFFDGGPFSHEIYAHTPCAVLFFSRERLLELLAAEPALWKYLGKLQSMKLRLANFLLDELSGMTIEMRLARRLLAKAAGYGMRIGFSPRISLRQEHLARSLGLARASVTPILQDWRRRGLVELLYGGMALRDIAELKLIARYSEWPDFYKQAFDLPQAVIGPDEAGAQPPSLHRSNP